MRPSKRLANEMRKVKIEIDENSNAEGAVMISFGETKVYCTATLENKVPRFLKGSRTGWVTAEYGMLPRSTGKRMDREAKQGIKPRSHEIQRLIARSLRTAVNLKALGERQIILDCDVIKADGGTRTAAITGAFVALSLAVRNLMTERKLSINPVKNAVVAISCGIYNGEPVLDLDYAEDSNATVDANFVFNDQGKIVEIQGTGEERAFSKEELDKMFVLAERGAGELLRLQRKALMYNVE